MANVLLTETCVRSCPYCFAKQYMSDTDMKDILSWDNLIYIADFLQSSNEDHISLLGGEPLLHPEIGEFIYYLSKRGMYVTIFTSGVMPDTKFDLFVEKLHSIRENINVNFVCNVNEPRLSPKTELEKVRKFLSTFNNRCSLSFNIYRLDFDMSFLIDYIIDYSLFRHVRLGLAHPIPEAKNLYINPDKFQDVKIRLFEEFSKMSQFDIVPGFDCGFPMCMFSDEELGKMYKYAHGQLSFQCGPAIDIGTDLSCWSCFPLSNFKKRSLLEFTNYQEMVSYYMDEMQKIRKDVRGIYSVCDNCNNNKFELCSGGCLAHIINKYFEEGNIR